jgi:hypothetical protein
MEQRTAITFCVKLKNAATETFEMLKSAYGEECLPRSVIELNKRFKNSSSESETAKIEGENNIDCTS